MHSPNKRLSEVKYPYWEIGFDEGLGQAWDERKIRIDEAIKGMLESGITLKEIQYYTEVPPNELERIFDGIHRRKAKE